MYSSNERRRKRCLRETITNGLGDCSDEIAIGMRPYWDRNKLNNHVTTPIPELSPPKVSKTNKMSGARSIQKRSNDSDEQLTKLSGSVFFDAEHANISYVHLFCI